MSANENGASVKCAYCGSVMATEPRQQYRDYRGVRFYCSDSCFLNSIEPVQWPNQEAAE